MRADRLLSLILLLHARGRMTAEALAEHLEVSERTIYRDLDALSTAGIPVYTQSGANGGVFLDENYRLSLTGLSRSEVQSLFVSSDAGPLKDLGLGKAVEDTLLKIFAALPNAHRAEVEQMRQRFHIDPANWFQVVELSPFLSILQQAVWEDWQVRITYQPVEGQLGERVIDAYALVAKANIWYLVGKKQGGEMHNYRVARFKEVALADTHFERDLDFDLATYWKESCDNFQRMSKEMSPPYEATLRVHSGKLWYFPAWMEGKYRQIGEPDAEGWYTLQVTFASPEDALTRMLGLGAGVVVIEPEALQLDILDVARSILDFHGVAHERT